MSLCHLSKKNKDPDYFNRCNFFVFIVRYVKAAMLCFSEDAGLREVSSVSKVSVGLVHTSSCWQEGGGRGGWCCCGRMGRELFNRAFINDTVIKVTELNSPYKSVVLLLKRRDFP